MTGNAIPIICCGVEVIADDECTFADRHGRTWPVWRWVDRWKIVVHPMLVEMVTKVIRQHSADECLTPAPTSAPAIRIDATNTWC